MDQDKLVKAIQSNIDSLDKFSTASFVVFTAIIVGTLGGASGWNVLGVSLSNPGYAYVGVAILVIAITVLVGDKFARIADYCAMLDKTHLHEAMELLFLHSWAMNPFSFLPHSRTPLRSEFAVAL